MFLTVFHVKHKKHLFFHHIPPSPLIFLRISLSSLSLSLADSLAPPAVHHLVKTITIIFSYLLSSVNCRIENRNEEIAEHLFHCNKRNNISISIFS